MNKAFIIFIALLFSPDGLRVGRVYQTTERCPVATTELRYELYYLFGDDHYVEFLPAGMPVRIVKQSIVTDPPWYEVVPGTSGHTVFINRKYVK